MERKIQITVCMGSSCFARGNSNLHRCIKDYLTTKGLIDRVSFKGQHCTTNCSKGPILMVESEILEGVTIENFADLIDPKLEKYL